MMCVCICIQYCMMHDFFLKLILSNQAAELIYSLQWPRGYYSYPAFNSRMY